MTRKVASSSSKPLRTLFSIASNPDAEILEYMVERHAVGWRKRRVRTSPPAEGRSLTIDDLGKLKKNPWRAGLVVRGLFPGWDRKSKKQRRELLARRKKPVVAPEDRGFETMIEFFDSHAGGVDDLVESGDAETKILHEYVQQHIWTIGTFAVQATWSEDRRERCRRGLTKDEIRKLRLLFNVRIMRDPTGH